MPVLKSMGTKITHVGPSGAGQLTKAINQTIIAGVYLSVAEGTVLGLKAGLDMDKGRGRGLSVRARQPPGLATCRSKT